MVFGFLKKKPVDPEVDAAYKQAYRKARLERAEKEGYLKGSTPQRRIIKAQTVSRQILSGLPKLTNPNDPFGLNTPPPARKKKKKQTNYFDNLP